MAEKTYLETWIDNYKGVSPEAKSLLTDGTLKKNYGGHSYVPWAIMERLMKMQDPTSTVVFDENCYDGTPLHTSYSNILTNDGTTETRVTVMTHFVKCTATFMGYTMKLIYPVQDSAYKAPKVVDSNMVNKAMQRAKAKIISEITGIAYKLYEDGDLQFEDDGGDETPTSLEATPNHKYVEAAEFIIANKDKLTTAIGRTNTRLIKAGSSPINPDKDDVVSLTDKLAKGLDDIDAFYAFIKSGVKE